MSPYRARIEKEGRMVSTSTMVTDERKWLAGSLDGLDDDGITAFVALMGGADPLVELVFLLMPQELNPEVAEDGVIAWTISTPDRTFSYWTEISEGTLTAEEGEPVTSRVHLSMTLPVFLRLVTDLQDAVKAFAEQEVRVHGDLLYAMRVQGMFRATPPTATGTIA